MNSSDDSRLDNCSKDALIVHKNSSWLSEVNKCLSKSAREFTKKWVYKFEGTTLGSGAAKRTYGFSGVIRNRANFAVIPKLKTSSRKLDDIVRVTGDSFGVPKICIPIASTVTMQCEFYILGRDTLALFGVQVHLQSKGSSNPIDSAFVHRLTRVTVLTESIVVHFTTDRWQFITHPYCVIWIIPID